MINLIWSMNISDLFTGQLTLASLVSAGIVLAVYLGGLIFTVLLVIGIIERIRWKNDSKKSSLSSKKITISMIGLFVVFVIWGAINLVNFFFLNCFFLGNHKNFFFLRY